MSTKTILCYGDSNTWGKIPGEASRYNWDTRWTGVLQKELGERVRIIEEGLCGRTTSFDDPLFIGRNGRAALPTILETHTPIDLLIIMLGTNDLKTHLNLSPFAIAHGAAKLLELANDFRPSIPNVLLVCPPHICATNNLEKSLAFEGSIEKSKELARHYEYFSSKFDCHFLDAALLTKTSNIDGIHMDNLAHKSLAEGLTIEINRILKNN